MSLPALQRAARIAGWLAVLAVVIVSTVPGAARPQSGLPGLAEHFVAYLAVAALLAFGQARRASPGVVALLLALAAAGLELAQMLVPGRSPGLFDAAAGAAGAFAGAGIARLALWRRRGPA